MVQAEPAIEQLMRLKAELKQVKQERNELREFVEKVANRWTSVTPDESETRMEARREEAQDLLKGKQ